MFVITWALLLSRYHLTDFGELNEYTVIAVTPPRTTKENRFRSTRSRERHITRIETPMTTVDSSNNNNNASHVSISKRKKFINLRDSLSVAYFQKCLLGEGGYA
jgi:hypothetical protein